MEIIRFPARSDWRHILKRPALDAAALEETVRPILNEVKEAGDEAVRKYTLQFDKVAFDELSVRAELIEAAASQVPEELKAAILVAKKNIETFHRAQLLMDKRVETSPGVWCWQKMVPVEKIGLYIPGGSAPLFSTILMLAIPATLAGCAEIVLCSPPDTQGRLADVILYTAALVGVSKIFRVGGVQAIAALSYGTASIPQVYKIFGPGNQYVTCAKQLVQRDGVAIDLPAGPSELAVFGDKTANATFVAADLLSQAEHGVDSQVLFVTDHEPLLDQVVEALRGQVAMLPRRNIALRALEHSRVVLVKSEQEAIALLNEYAPEHLILACEHAGVLAEQVVNAGSVFLGHYSPESAGDYASGTNHTLPTNGWARSYGGVNMDSFVKKITFQELSRQGLAGIAKAIETMAEAEGLLGHAAAVRVRSTANPKSTGHS